MNAFSRSVRQVIGHVFVDMSSRSRVSDNTNDIYTHLLGQLVLLARYFDGVEISKFDVDKAKTSINILQTINPSEINDFTLKVREAYEVLGIKFLDQSVN